MALEQGARAAKQTSTRRLRSSSGSIASEAGALRQPRRARAVRFRLASGSLALARPAEPFPAATSIRDGVNPSIHLDRVGHLLDGSYSGRLYEHGCPSRYRGRTRHPSCCAEAGRFCQAWRLFHGVVMVKRVVSGFRARSALSPSGPRRGCPFSEWHLSGRRHPRPRPRVTSAGSASTRPWRWRSRTTSTCRWTGSPRRSRT